MDFSTKRRQLYFFILAFFPVSCSALPITERYCVFFLHFYLFHTPAIYFIHSLLFYFIHSLYTLYFFWFVCLLLHIESICYHCYALDTTNVLETSIKKCENMWYCLGIVAKVDFKFTHKNASIVFIFLIKWRISFQWSLQNEVCKLDIVFFIYA